MSPAALPVVMVAAHHGLEAAAGIGLPLEPVLGRRCAAGWWVVALSADLALALATPTAGRSVGRPRLLALGTANGIWQALALQHYVDWPWRVRGGLPWITDAEGLPPSYLRAYNPVLLMIAATSGVATASLRSRTATMAHLCGLATMPAQLASARRHQAWIANMDSRQDRTGQ